MPYPVTPDGRYFIVNGRLWRRSDPALSRERHDALVKDLMHARRAVAMAKKAQDSSALKKARQAVNRAKVSLGERGPPWWDDGAPDYTRKLAINTPYSAWYDALLQAGSEPSRQEE